MNKFYLIAARTALLLLPASILCIMANTLLSQTPFGMITFMWRPSWVIFSFSISVLLIMIRYEDRRESAERQREKRSWFSARSNKENPVKNLSVFNRVFVLTCSFVFQKSFNAETPAENQSYQYHQYQSFRAGRQKRHRQIFGEQFIGDGKSNPAQRNPGKHKRHVPHQVGKSERVCGNWYTYNKSDQTDNEHYNIRIHKYKIKN